MSGWSQGNNTCHGTSMVDQCEEAGGECVTTRQGSPLPLVETFGVLQRQLSFTIYNIAWSSLVLYGVKDR